MEAQASLQIHKNGHSTPYEAIHNENEIRVPVTESVAEASTTVEFVVGGILKRRWSRSKKHYEWLVRWEGFSELEDTWEPEDFLSQVQ